MQLLLPTSASRFVTRHISLWAGKERQLSIRKITKNCYQYPQLADRHNHALQRTASTVQTLDRSWFHGNHSGWRRMKGVRLCDFGYNKSRKRLSVSAWLEVTILKESEHKLPYNSPMRHFFRHGVQKGRFFCKGFGERWNPYRFAKNVCGAITREKIELLIVGHEFIRQSALHNERIKFLGWAHEAKAWCDKHPHIPGAAPIPSFHSNIPKYWSSRWDQIQERSVNEYNLAKFLT